MTKNNATDILDDENFPEDLPATTVWIENELRRLDAERLLWMARWQSLKSWLADRRNAPDWTTLGMIEYHMSTLEQQSPTFHPPRPAYTIHEDDTRENR